MGSEGFNKEKVKVPILAMKGGNDLQTYIDILVPNNAKLTLIKGEGPIHLIGSHCIDFYDNMAGEADSEGEDEDMEVSQEKGKGKDISASPIKTTASSGQVRLSAPSPRTSWLRAKWAWTFSGLLCLWLPSTWPATSLCSWVLAWPPSFLSPLSSEQQGLPGGLE